MRELLIRITLFLSGALMASMLAHHGTDVRDMMFVTLVLAVMVGYAAVEAEKGEK